MYEVCFKLIIVQLLHAVTHRKFFVTFEHHIWHVYTETNMLYARSCVIVCYTTGMLWLVSIFKHDIISWKFTIDKNVVLFKQIRLQYLKSRYLSNY